MTKKTCGFCGEPIAGGLQEHDFATCAHNLKDKVAQLEAVLADIEEYGTEEINAAVAMRQRIAQLEIELDGWKTEAANRKFIYEKAKEQVAKLEAELAGMVLMEAEGESFAKDIVAENVLLKAEAEAAGAVLLDVQQDCINLRKELEQLRVEGAESGDC